METQAQSAPPLPVKIKRRDFSNTTPGYKIYEYSLLLNPPEALCDKIMRVKQYFFDSCKNSTAIDGNPHVTMVNFIPYALLEMPCYCCGAGWME